MSDITMEGRLKELHSQLRRAKYFYFELSHSIITDYEYDTLEKEYEMLCEKFKIIKKHRISEIVGWSVMIPMDILNFID
jgi:NAD-dependent DNA ligase